MLPNPWISANCINSPQSSFCCFLYRTPNTISGTISSQDVHQKSTLCWRMPGENKGAQSLASIKQRSRERESGGILQQQDQGWKSILTLALFSWFCSESLSNFFRK
uniref:Uncharacterized protein n=1 Tax=Opuntia streptacantha TaxID=393608 RepID=A0A7C9AWT5_OPUST